MPTTSSEPTGSSSPEAGAEGRLLTPGELEQLRAHEAAIHEADFILCWEKYGRERTDAPIQFHRLAAYVLVSMAIDRNRWLALQHKTVYPSIYGFALAESGQRKSTPLEYAVTAAGAAMKNRILSNDYSPEALIEDLSIRKPSRGVVFSDEAGRLLGTMRRNRYGEGLKDILSRLWDAPEHLRRQLRSSDRQPSEFNLQSVYVNAVMATTLSRFAEMVTPEDVMSGFLARFLPMVATEKITRKRLSKATTEMEQDGQNLTEDLKKMYQRLAESPKAMRITDDALNRLDLAEQDLETWAAQQFHADLIQPWAKRLSEYAQRLSVIFAVSEGQDAIERAQVLRAVECIDRAKEDVAMLAEELTKGPQARKLDKVDRFIRANPGISSRDLQRKTGMVAKEAREVTDELIKLGRIWVKVEGSNRPRYYPGPVSQPGTP